VSAGVHLPGYTDRYNAARRASVLASKAERSCAFCGATIPVTMNRNARHCSDKCLTAAHCARLRAKTACAREARGIRMCAYCDGPMGRHPIPATSLPHAKHCSAACYAAAYDRAHREEIAARNAARYSANPEAMRAASIASHAAHPEVRQLWRARHREEQSEYFRGRREALAGLSPYPRMEPWPTDCQCCGEPIDPALSFPNALSESFGHEPPIRWAERHPEYDGPFALRPEHLVCNQRKNDRPDWELSVERRSA
jgi:hypothetical protein